MKPQFLIVLLLGALAAGQQTPPPAAQSQDANAQKAHLIIQQAIQALGGQAYLTYTDMEQQGRTYGFYHGESQGGGTVFWRFWKWPDKDRFELTKERDVIDIYNGDKAYELTYKGVGQVDPEAVADYMRRRQYSIEWVMRRWIPDPTVAFFYEGEAVADAKPADKVTLINTRNQSVTLYISTDTHLPIRKTFQWRDTDRTLVEEAESWDNYRPVQGIMTPHSITRYKSGEIVNQRFLTTITYNQNLSDSLFTATSLTPPKESKGKKK